MLRDDARIQMAHGGGGRQSQQLIQELVLPAFRPADGVLHDAALLERPGQKLAFTTDSYVVRPLFFPGGDIGRLAVFGSVNDLAMVGARPVALSLGLILEEGLQISTLKQVIRSIRNAADQCNVEVVTGDTKVVEHGKGDGICINTSAIGVVDHTLRIHPSSVQAGDALLVSGDLGCHGTAILMAREELGFHSTLESDLAPLQNCVQALISAQIDVHCLRDLTRGGLASASVEIAQGAGCAFEIEEKSVPVNATVRSACELLGLDPLAMANEGRMLVICPDSQAQTTLNILKERNSSAALVGRVKAATPAGVHHPVLLRSEMGVLRPLNLDQGEQLPRIC